MAYDEALNHLAINRPRQSVYLQLLPALRMTDSARGTTSSSDEDLPQEKTSGRVSSAPSIQQLAKGVEILCGLQESSNLDPEGTLPQQESSSSSNETLFPSPN